MRLGGEVDHRIMAGNDLAEERSVTDITMHEGEPRAARDRLHVSQVARIGQLVQDGHLGLLEPRVAAGQHGPDIV